MSASFYDLLKFAKTGVASPDMTHYDKQKALAMCKAGFPVKTLTGVPPISFKSDGTPLTAWSIIGNMVQSSVPTPSAPITPEECGEKTGNIISIDMLSNDISLISNTGLPQLGYGRVGTENPIDVSAYTYVTLSYNNDDVYFMYSLYSGSTYIGRYTNNRSGSTVDVSNADKMYICFYKETNILKSYLSNIMLNSGSTAMDYEPYGYKIPITNGNTTYNIYLTESLRKIGDYGDSVSSDGTVTRRIKKIVLDGTETYTKNNTSATDYLYYAGRGSLLPSSISQTPIMCSHLQEVATAPTGENTGISTTNNFNAVYLNFGADIMNAQTSGNTANGLKEYLAAQYSAGTPVCVWYVLATPTTETVTAPTITPAKGANTLSIGTTLAPSEVSITGGIK